MKSPNEKGALLHAPIPKLKLHLAYCIAAVLATAFGRPFWSFERWRGRLQDQIENEEDNR